MKTSKIRFYKVNNINNLCFYLKLELHEVEEQKINYKLYYSKRRYLFPRWQYLEDFSEIEYFEQLVQRFFGFSAYMERI
jgi:hypothetical protein